MSMENDREVWYAVEYSDGGANDWYRSAEQHDTAKAAQSYMSKLRDSRSLQAFDYRVVKVIATREVIGEVA